ncbi:hypothetical protein [Sphingomonas sp. GM_Shp_1]|uniref:hypothetical protein n=1 Tax=Sphingomonas sp. GM_Shp_1 TaxID=2937381 RepID=UPI00226B0030|nr:hypothetical protein [Sphingomonas sp. GM_Shp_1]
MADRWRARAAVLRQQPDKGSQTIAGVLERVAAGMLAEVSAAAVEPAPIAVPATTHDADFWSAHLAACQPYRCPRSGVMINEGEIMDRVRERLRARIDGRPLPQGRQTTSVLVSAASEPVFAPPPEVIPFTVGPQTDMFGMLG